MDVDFALSFKEVGYTCIFMGCNSVICSPRSKFMPVSIDLILGFVTDGSKQEMTPVMCFCKKRWIYGDGSIDYIYILYGCVWSPGSSEGEALAC